MTAPTDHLLESLSPVILASASPRRRELLAQLDVEFDVISSDASELHDENLTGRELAQINAYRKARAVAKEHPDNLVIGADTLVYLGTRVYGKPRDAADAKRMLRELSGQAHSVVTGVCLIHLRSHRQKTFAECTHVTFRDLDDQAIGRYVQNVHTLDKAGAYAIQEFGSDLVKAVDGSFSNVVGLPLERLKDELEAWAGSARHAHVGA